MKSLKRIIALNLALIMLLAVGPVSVLAEELVTADMGTLTLGKKRDYTTDEDCYFSFTPTKSGWYQFTLTAYGEGATSGNLKMGFITEFDDEGEVTGYDTYDYFTQLETNPAENESQVSAIYELESNLTYNPFHEVVLGSPSNEYSLIVKSIPAPTLTGNFTGTAYDDVGGEEYFGNATYTLNPTTGIMNVNGIDRLDSRSDCVLEPGARRYVKSLIIDSGISEIGAHCFEGLENLQSITIPETVTKIGDYAFNRCIGLVSVNIPKSVDSIGQFAFANTNLISVIFLGNAPSEIYESDSQYASFHPDTWLTYTIGTSGWDYDAEEGVWKGYTITQSIYFYSSISLNVNHALLSDENNSFKFTAFVLDGVEYDINDPIDIEWSIDDTEHFTASEDGDGNYVVTVSNGLTSGYTAVVTAAIDEDGDGEYELSASATVEYVNGNIINDYDVRLLETKAAVNRKAEKGALIPFKLLPRTQSDMVSAGMPAMTGSPFSGVRLLDANGWDIKGYSAHIYNGSTIEINADATAKSASKVNVYFIPRGKENDSAYWIKAAQQISLSLADKLPPYKITADPLNLFFPNSNSIVYVDCKEDAYVTRIESEYFNFDGHYVSFLRWPPSDDDNNLYPIATAGTKTVTAEIKIEGYKPFLTTFKVKVVMDTPKYKLSKTSVSLNSDGNAMIQILPGASANISPAFTNIANVYIRPEKEITSDVPIVYDPSQEGYDASKLDVVISSFDPFAGNITLNYNNNPTAVDAATTKYVVVAYIFNTYWKVALPLTINKKAVAPNTVTIGIKSATINSSQVGNVITIPFKTNPVDIDVYGEFTSAYGQAPPFAVVLSRSGNNMILELPDLIAKGVYKLKLTFKDSATHEIIGKPLDFTLTVVDKTPTMSISLKGKIDILDPYSFITATVKLSNTSAKIIGVHLFNAAELKNAVLNGGDLDALADKTDFFVTDIDFDAGTFIIYKRPEVEVIPGVAQKLSVAVVLNDNVPDNGSTVLTTWVMPEGRVKFSDKPISITPYQPAVKAIASTTTATLYKTHPTEGERFSVDITPYGLTVHDVRINTASVAKFPDVFELVKNGGTEWTLQLNQNLTPAQIAALKSSYTVKLDVIPELMVNGDGEQIAKTKPGTITMKVSIK